MNVLKTITINGTTYKVTAAVPADNVTLLASAWKSDGEAYSQVVDISGITAHTKVDLQPTSEQLVAFHSKDLAFVAENDGGTVTVFAIGDKPAGDHTIQITKTEVEGTGKIRGNTVGTNIKPEKVLVKCGNLTEEEKAQARANIGIKGNEIQTITRFGAPTAATEGSVGQFYMNTYTGEMYKCTDVYENEGEKKYTWTFACDGLIPLDPIDFLTRRESLPKGSRYLITANNAEAELKKGDLVFIEDGENHYIEGNICAEEEKCDRQIHFYTTEEYQRDLPGYLIPGDVYIITEGDLRGNIYVATADDHSELKGNISGADGKTPVKGVDYHTEVDKQEMVEAVLAALPNGDEVAY